MDKAAPEPAAPEPIAAPTPTPEPEPEAPSSAPRIPAIPNSVTDYSGPDGLPEEEAPEQFPPMLISYLLSIRCSLRPWNGDVIDSESDTFVLGPGKGYRTDTGLVVLQAESLSIDRKVTIHLE